MSPAPSAAPPEAAPAPRRRRRVSWVLVAAILAALPHFARYASEVERDEYPGDFNPWRIQALLGVARVAVNGGPFATTHDEAGLTTEPGLLDDLGMAAIVDGVSRLRGRPGGRRLLGRIDLVFVAAAYVSLLLAFPRAHRLGLTAVFLAFPIAVPEWRSPDVLAIHGALAALAVAAALGVQRVRPGWLSAALGLLFFVLHKMRAAYGLYAIAAAFAAALGLALLRRSPRPLLRPLLALVVFLGLGVPWNAALDARTSDPRVGKRAELHGHNLYGALVSGVGWSENPWGLRPWDPVVSTFIAERTGSEPVPLETLAGERRARQVYLSLWREAPLALLGIYLGRLPFAVDAYFPFGWIGGAAWLGLGLAAARLAWRRRDSEALVETLAPQLLVAALLLQVMLVDTRPLYAYPLRFNVALAVAAAATSLVQLRGRGPGGPDATERG